MKEIINKAALAMTGSFIENGLTMLLDFVTKNSSISMLDSSITNYERRIQNIEARLEKERKTTGGSLQLWKGP